MAAKKQKKHPPKTLQKNSNNFPYLAIIGIFVIGAFLAILSMLPVPDHAPTPQKPPFEEPEATKKPIIPSPALPESTPEAFPKTFDKPQAKDNRPYVAIIIDDMGYDLELNKLFLSMEAKLSFAFLPYAPFSQKLAGLAAEKKKDILLHQPLEPENGELDPGKGVLLTNMPANKMMEILKNNLNEVPGAKGVNGHMGSKFTKDKNAMEILLAGIKMSNLFYLDSYTSAESVAEEVAKTLGNQIAKRNVFLDHVITEEAISHELSRLVKIAQKNGHAIAIGHPHKETYEVLYNELPVIQKQVRIVPISKLIESAK